jgi:sugar lactone lactonase YvrE
MGMSGCIPAINPNAGYKQFSNGLINYSGTNLSLYNYPRGMAVDSNGDIFVVDGGNNRIIEIPASSPGTPAPVTTTAWNTFPNGNTPSKYSFNAPEGIAVDSLGNIWVADSGNGRIVQLTTDWQSSNPTVTIYNSAGTYSFSYPTGLAYNSNNNYIYITDPGKNFPNSIPSVFAILVGSPGTFTFEHVVTGFGSGIRQFSFPRGIAADSSGVYIADETNYRIVKMDLLLSTSNWTTLGTRGSGTGQFISPQTIALDSVGAGHIYVVDAANYWVVKMNDISGAGWTQYGIQSGTSTTSVYPSWVAVFSSSPPSIYVSDDTNYQIAEFQ